MSSHLATLLQQLPNVGMAKSKNTFGFRPEPWDEDAIQAAELATGVKRSELIRRCVRAGIGQVVREILKEHETSVEQFNTVLRQAASKPKPPK